MNLDLSIGAHLSKSCAVPENTGLILCSDGVQHFKSSKQAFWPVLLTVTCLPPGIRMNAENIILAGVWQAPVKRPMNVILTPVLDKIQDLSISGMPVLTLSGLKAVRACLLTVCLTYLQEQLQQTSFSLT